MCQYCKERDYHQRRVDRLTKLADDLMNEGYEYDARRILLAARDAKRDVQTFSRFCKCKGA